MLTLDKQDLGHRDGQRKVPSATCRQVYRSICQSMIGLKLRSYGLLQCTVLSTTCGHDLLFPHQSKLVCTQHTCEDEKACKKTRAAYQRAITYHKHGFRQLKRMRRITSEDSTTRGRPRVSRKINSVAFIEDQESRYRKDNREREKISLAKL